MAVSVEHHVQRRRAPSRRWLRLSVLLRRQQLDGRLAAGADPPRDPALALRAEQLTSRRSLDGLALGLERVLDAAEEPPLPPSARVPLQREEILACTAELRALAADLRAGASPEPRGAALVSGLLRDGASPLYSPSSPGDLWAAVRRAREALERP